MNVQDAGGLPDYICVIARAIKRSGKTTSEAISIAVDRVKVWATGKGVDKDTQTKAAAALAEWEAKRAKTHAKTAAKDAVKATSVSFDASDIDLLRAVSFTPKCEMHPLDVVRSYQPAGSALGQILAFAADKETGNQYGDVAYADTKNKKYPIDTAAHVRAAWSYINQAGNAKGYSPAEVAAIKARIKTAAKKFNIEISD